MHLVIVYVNRIASSSTANVGDGSPPHSIIQKNVGYFRKF